MNGLLDRLKSLRPPKAPTFLVPLVVAAGLTLAGTARAEEVVRVFGRAELVARALEHRRDVAAARLGVEAAKADRAVATKWRNPGLTVQGATLAHGTAVNGLDMGFVQLDQEIPLAGQVPARVREAERGMGAAAADVRALERSIVLEVDGALLELQLAELRLAVHEDAAKEIDRMATVVVARSVAGANAVYDRLRVEAAQRKVRADLLDARAAREVARFALVAKVDPALADEPFRVPELRLDARPLPELESLRTLVDAKHASLVVERSRAELLAASVDRVDRERIPSPDVQLAYQPNFRIPVDTGYATGGYVQVGVSMPLPILDTGSARVRRAELDVTMQKLRLEGVRRALFVEVALARRLVELRARAFAELDREDAAGTENLRTLASIAYREGTLGVLELVDAHQSLTDARLRRIDLDASLARAWLDLEAAVGVDLYAR